VNDPGSGVNVWAGSGRSGCTSSVSATHNLWIDVPAWPDNNVAKLGSSGTNFGAAPYTACSITGSRTFYGSIDSSTGTSLEGHHEVEC